MRHQPPELRLHRTLLLVAGSAYLAWWGFVHLALPAAFNPFGSRLLVVALFFTTFAASYAVPAVARHLEDCLALCCGFATLHYFYLFERNHADLTWTIGSYITVVAACAVLQTARSLLAYSLFVAALSVAFVLEVPGANVVFLPGMLTNLLFANLGLFGRLRLLDRLSESRERIEGLFDATFEGVAVHEQGIIRAANGGLARLLGRSRAELIGMPVADLLAPEARGRAALDGEEALECEVLAKDGARTTVELRGKAHVVDGRPMRLLAFRDLTERKLAENALRQTNRELEAFSYSVAHDLRAPLRAIDGFGRALLEDHAARLEPEARDHLERILVGATTMGQLIDALLGLARVTQKELLRDTVDLSVQAEAVAKQLQAAQPDRRVDFVSQGGLVAQGDPQLLTALLDNLLGNAWKFTARRAPASVTFGSTQRNGQAVYYVRDNGAGFDMAYVDKLFAPFQRLHKAEDYPGTGIGLATVQRIVHRHGGRVWAEGVLNGGATIYFTLPLVRAEEPRRP